MGDIPINDEDSRLFSENGRNLTIFENVNLCFPSCTKRSTGEVLDMAAVHKKTRLEVVAEQNSYIEAFSQWNEDDQVDFLCHLLSRMSHAQHSQINNLLEPLLQCDIIAFLPSRGVPNISADILSYLDANSLLSVELVSKSWQTIVVRFQLWRKLIARCIEADHVWYGLAERRGWLPIIQLVDPSILASLLEERLAVLNCGLVQKRESEFPSMKLPGQLLHPAPFGDNWSLLLPASFTSAAANAVASTSPTPTYSQSCRHEKMMLAHHFYKQLYPRLIRDIHRTNDNWNQGRFRLTRILCHSDSSKGVYCLQYDSDKIVSGLRDDTIKVWRRVATTTTNKVFKPCRTTCACGKITVATAPVSTSSTAAEGGASTANEGSEVVQSKSNSYECTQVLRGHEGSVLCLQYEGNLLISGSSDSKVRLWDLSTGDCLHILEKHNEAVLHLRFRNNVLVTCSKDRNIAVWDMGALPKDIQLRVILSGHRAAVNVVDFDERYIVSASGDRTIKVWRTDATASNPVRTLSGHRRGIACLQYRAPYVVSGSSDFTIRIWDIETGVCFRVLEGHDELVRCIRFDSKRIVSGAYDGKIKIWDFKAALNPRSRANQLCIKTLQEHTGRVFRLQFDDFQIVSSSHDDSILIWDFTHVDSDPKNHHEDEAGMGENDDGFFNEEAAAAAAGGMPNYSNLRQIRLVHSHSPQLTNRIPGGTEPLPATSGDAAGSSHEAPVPRSTNPPSPHAYSPASRRPQT